MEECQRTRADFDRILESKNRREIDLMLEKYERYIENYFEPDFPLHHSRPHSPMYGKHTIFTDE